MKDTERFKNSSVAAAVQGKKKGFGLDCNRGSTKTAMKRYPPAAMKRYKDKDKDKDKLVPKLVIRWRHLHKLQIWLPGCVTCIATLPWIALLTLPVSIELVSSSARVTSVKSSKRCLIYFETSRPIDRTPGTPGSNKKNKTKICPMMH